METVRYYQRRGLVPEPARPPGGIRRYAQEHARRLRFIREAQKLGFSLDEVSELLSLEDGLHCREVEEIAGHKLAAVRERMAQLAGSRPCWPCSSGNATGTEASCAAP